MAALPIFFENSSDTIVDTDCLSPQKNLDGARHGDLIQSKDLDLTHNSRSREDSSPAAANRVNANARNLILGSTSTMMSKFQHDRCDVVWN